MRHPPRILVLDFGASRVAAAVFALKPSGELILERFDCEPHASPLTAENEAASLAPVLAALAARESWEGPCAFAVPGDRALVKFIKVPKVESSKRQQIIKFEAAQSIPYALEEVCWGTHGFAGAGNEEECIVAAVKTEAMAAWCAALAVVRLTPERAMPGCFALWRAWQYNYAAQSESALIVDVGARSTRLIFAAKQNCFLRTLPLGGETITQAIADELALEIGQAEQLKIQLMGEEGAPAPENLAERDVVMRAADRFAQRLQSELARAVLGHARRPEATPMTRLLLTGGGARCRGLALALSVKLNLPVQAYEPLNGVEVSGRAKTDALDTAQHQLAVLTGLASAVLRPEAAPLDLLPATIQQQRIRRRAQPWWVAAAALVVGAAVPPAWHLHAAAKEAKAEAVRLELEVAPLRRLLARNEANLARLDGLQREVSALGNVMTARSSWRGLLADLERELVAVEDVWLDRLVIADDLAGSVETLATRDRALRVAVSGRLLDVQNPVSQVGPQAYVRVKDMLTRIAASRFVTGVEGEQFDNSRPGILQFGFTLIMNPEHPL